MAKKKYDGPLTRHSDFTHAGPNNEPASGLAVQNYIKGIDAKKVGVGYTLPNGTAHYLFADAEDRDAFIADPTRLDLVIDTISLESIYKMYVTLISGDFVPVPLGSTGNYIRFTFATKDKAGDSVSEPVTVVFTITRGSSSKIVTQVYQAGTTVAFNIDQYLLEGTNNVSVSVTGNTTNASSTVGITYQVINTTFSDSLDISTVYNLATHPNQTVAIPYAVSGAGVKTMEWYVDGVQLAFVRAEDEITEVSTERTKYIPLAGLSQGVHSIQFRAGIQISGETFYTQTLYREVIVNTGNAFASPVVAIATSLPAGTVLDENDDIEFAVSQYETLKLRVAAWNPSGAYQNTVVATCNLEQIGSVLCSEGVESTLPLVFKTTGNKTVLLSIGAASRTILLDVAETTMNIAEITSGLEFNFEAEGRTNSAPNKDTWTDGVHTATFAGFDWNDNSGWQDGKLLIPSGASVSFDYAPLANDATEYGKTIEIEFKTVNVDNDDAVLLNLIDANGAGIKLTATELQVKSRGGVNISRRFKTDETVRASIVINRLTGTTNKQLVFVYLNGINSMAAAYAVTDSFVTAGTLAIGGTGAGILLKQVRIYNNALTSDGVLNNFILYRDSVSDMVSIYERNAITDITTGKFDLDKIASRLPVMVITGNIPAIEATTDKKLQITADIRYTNLQDPTRSFRMVNAIVTGQGTSSMTYPKKNLRIYTRKSDSTVLYDASGNVVTNRLYSFKEGAQPVDCWCLKTDFAESSGTHNTGVARLWNDVTKAVQVSNQYVLRTEAQKTAAANSYPYDVRTTVDGFPIAVFYHLTEQDDLIFLGKYNFNNDKSTESVFGFTGIPNFDDSNVQCFEFLDSGNTLALFQTVEGFDSNWSKAWESRYPDTKTPNLVPLKTLATWLVSTYGADPNGDADAQAKFAEWQAHKADHFDLYKLASYYVYLMRFGAVDQTVKNSMLMTEDGVHWFFILYDNDTIFGVRNDGLLRYAPTIDRQTPDAEIGGYAYAGHGATIWNNFEADPECMALAKMIDSALYTAGLTYENMINMFNNLQAGKWAETIYNQDAQYKYVGPYTNQGLDYLGSLQGSRADHRKWWIASRMALYDALFVNGAYEGKAITLLVPGAQQGTTFGITSGKDFYYGYGENNLVLSSGNHIAEGSSHTFTLSKNMEIGSPLRIYAPYYINTLDLSNFITYIGATNFNLSAANDATLGTKLKNLILGVSNPTTDLRRNNALTGLSGLSSLVALESLNIAGYTAITSLDLSSNKRLTTLKALASGLTAVTFAQGSPLELIELPAGFQSLTLDSHKTLASSGIVMADNGVAINHLTIKDCTALLSTPDFVLNWLDNKTTADSGCTLELSGINWNTSLSNLMKLVTFVENGGTVSLRGVCNVGTIDSVATAERIMAALGNNVFSSTAPFHVVAALLVFISGPDTVLEGQSANYSCVVIGGDSATAQCSWSLVGSRTGTSINQSTGVLTTTENGLADSALTISVTYTDANITYTQTKNITVAKRTYPSASDVSISGNAIIQYGTPETYVLSLPSGITGDMTALWSLTGDLASYASITSQNNSQCVIALSSEPSTATVSGTLTLALTKTVDGSAVATKTFSVSYQHYTQLTVHAVTNQSDHSDVASATATVTYGGTTETVANHGTITVPTNALVTIAFSAVTGYATPAQQTVTATGNNQIVNMTYNTEVVTVTASTDQQGVTAEGQIITINGNAFTVGASGVVSAKVPYGVSYTVSGNKKTGYNSPAEQSFTANQASRSVTMQWTEKVPLPNGIYIIYSDNSYSNYDTLTSGKTPIGVGVVNSNVSLLLHPSEGSSKTWSSDMSTKISGVTTTTDQNTVKADYAGEDNTAAVIAAGKNGTAFDFCTALGGYLPSCGEMEQIRLNVTEVNTALNLIGGTALDFSSKNYWSSTQYSNGYAWFWYYDYSTWGGTTKDSNYYCRSVAAL